MPRIALRVKWVGDVQGVGFRAFVQHVADEHGVTGWVANAPDGSVTAEMEGERDAVRAAVAEALFGPRAAEVTRVEIELGEPEGMTDFEIRRGRD
ncbi:MAG TPA: acylphosphatase [Gemmataceae bacterium]